MQSDPLCGLCKYIIWRTAMEPSHNAFLSMPLYMFVLVKINLQNKKKQFPGMCVSQEHKK